MNPSPFTKNVIMLSPVTHMTNSAWTDKKSVQVISKKRTPGIERSNTGCPEDLLYITTTT